MESSKRAGAIVQLSGLMVLYVCLVQSSVSAAAVTVAQDVVADSDQQVLKELMSAFDRAEFAAQRADLDALMQFYEEGYNYHGLKRHDVRRVWAEVFSHYAHVMSKHVFTDLKVVRSGTAIKAYVTCTGMLFGNEKESGKHITIDSWTGEVHYLVKDKEAWKFVGNVGGALPEVPPSSAPHHPLF